MTISAGENTHPFPFRGWWSSCSILQWPASKISCCSSKWFLHSKFYATFMVQYWPQIVKILSALSAVVERLIESKRNKKWKLQCIYSLLYLSLKFFTILSGVWTRRELTLCYSSSDFYVCEFIVRLGAKGERSWLQNLRVS